MRSFCTTLYLFICLLTYVLPSFSAKVSSQWIDLPYIHPRKQILTINYSSTPTNNIKGQCPTETETKMANWPVIRSKRPPRWRGSHRVRKSTGWTLASTLAYGMQCIPIADQINNKKKLFFCIYLFVHLYSHWSIYLSLLFFYPLYVYKFIYGSSKFIIDIVRIKVMK